MCAGVEQGLNLHLTSSGKQQLNLPEECGSKVNCPETMLIQEIDEALAELRQWQPTSRKVAAVKSDSAVDAKDIRMVTAVQQRLPADHAGG